MASVQERIKREGLSTLGELYTQHLHANQSSKESKILLMSNVSLHYNLRKVKAVFHISILQNAERHQVG